MEVRDSLLLLLVVGLCVGLVFAVIVSIEGLVYTGCPRRNVKYFGRVFLMLNYTDITQNTYIQS